MLRSCTDANDMASVWYIGVVALVLRTTGNYLGIAIACLGGSTDTPVNLKFVSSTEVGTRNYRFVTKAASHVDSNMTGGKAIRLKCDAVSGVMHKAVIPHRKIDLCASTCVRAILLTVC